MQGVAFFLQQQLLFSCCTTTGGQDVHARLFSANRPWFRCLRSSPIWVFSVPSPQSEGSF